MDIFWTDEGRVRSIAWRSGGASTTGPTDADQFYTVLAAPTAVQTLIRGLQTYFNSGVPFELTSQQWEEWIDTAEWTPFQRAVLHAAAKIPIGETRTYAWVAAQIGRPFAMRAVGQALRRNPLMIVVPCHRVVSVRSLGGFMGEAEPEAFAMKLKQRLLDLEHDFRNPRLPFWMSDEVAV